MAGTAPREPLDPPESGEITLPNIGELLKENEDDLPETLFEYIPKIEEFGYQNEDLEMLEKWKISESKMDLGIQPGEKAGLKRLDEIFSTPTNFEDFFYVRNKFSQDKTRRTDLYPWLMWGWISIRRIYSKLSEFETEHSRIKNQISSFRTDILWKDYLKFWALK
jgi:deoxyribodipyrimidine photolyase